MGAHAGPPAAIAEVFITEELLNRVSSRRDDRRELLAIQDLARAMTDFPAEVLPRLVRLAMQICDADSAGVSVLEAGSQVFRWFGLAGRLAVFEGATTPREFSPCGVCLDQGSPVLMKRPERAYGWIRDAGISVPEVLLVPLAAPDEQLGTLWIVAPECRHFDSEHARVLTELASFAGVALRMILAEQKLAKALVEQETLATEMNHRLKNFFAIAESLIRTTARHTATKDELAQALSGRIHALAGAHQLVFGTRKQNAGDLTLGAVLARLLSPYEPAFELDGPDIRLGEKATTSLALVFHELATNATKYGALSQVTGLIAVRWQLDGDAVCIRWNESGGPAITAPDKPGFGSTLVQGALSGHGGTIDYSWDREGLAAVITAPADRLLI